MIAGRDEIRKIMPQGESMLMLDAVIELSGNTVRSSFAMNEKCLFAENNKLNTEGMIENMAQTAIAGSLLSKNKLSLKLHRAFIGGISKLKVMGEIKTGQELFTEVEYKTNLGNMFLVEAKILVTEKKMAQCELKLLVED